MHKTRRKFSSPLVKQAFESGEIIPLSKWLKERGMARSTFYTHPEIPRVKDGWHVYVPRAYEVRS